MTWTLFAKRNRKSSSYRAGRSARLDIESLEERQLLSTTNVISQFVVTDNGSRPAGIATGAPGDNELWFTDPQYNRIGRIETNGVFDTFIDLPTGLSNPQSITAGPDGNMWVMEAGANQVARVTRFGTVTEFRIPSALGGTVGRIVSGPDGNLWFTEPGASNIARLTTAGRFTEFPVPGYFRTNGPQDLAVGPDGNLWFTLPWANQVGYITTHGSFHMFTTGISPQAFPTGITAGPDGNLWFTEPAIDQVARITPAGVVTEFYIGITQRSAPTMITPGSDGALWFTEPVAAGEHWVTPHIGRITVNGVVTEYAVPNFGQCDGGITSGRDGNIWFTDSTGNIAMLNVQAIIPSNLFTAADAFTHSPEAYTYFVTQAYERYLGRAPDATGLSGWVSAMLNGLTDEQLEAGFIGSSEFYQHSGGTNRAWVDALYLDLLGRPADPASEAAWVQALVNGMARSTVAYYFAASPEREAIRIRNDYQTYLGRAASDAEVSAWTSAFTQGVTNETLVAYFVGSWEYYNNQHKGMGDNSDWVLSAFRDVLHRSPSTDELNAWMAYLAQG
jgi:streptogramin lyase